MALKDIPENFDIDSEEDLRIVVVKFFQELGFDETEISCEDFFSIRLGHTDINIDKENLNGRSDVLISRNGQPLAIVETKSPNHNLVDDDAKQAISYARLLTSIAPIAIVTNGAETRVYDVLANELTLLENSDDSIWSKNGQRVNALSEEIKFEASRLLIGLNPRILEMFCKQQVAFGLQDLKSSVSKRRTYIPELFVKRNLLDHSIDNWFLSNEHVFAVVAPSGYGKTNFMCAKAEEMLATQYCLFYNSNRFTGGIFQSIANDFSWELHQEKNVVQIFDRLQSIASATKKDFLIFIDAIDEHPKGLTAVKNELIELANRIEGYPNIRLILSCKEFDWDSVVIDNKQSYNRLAEFINPSIFNSASCSSTPSADNVGFHLGEFSKEEYSEAKSKYKTVFSLVGDFHEKLETKNRNPLFLRLVSETYEGKEVLPVDINDVDLFHLFFQMKLSHMKNEGIVKRILTSVANSVFSSGNRRLSQNRLFSSLPWGDGYDDSLKDLLRQGILLRVNVEGVEYLYFEFNQFQNYYYIFHVVELPLLHNSKLLETVRSLAKTEIGQEALQFYILTRNNEELLQFVNHIEDQDFPLLAQLITELIGLRTYEKSPIPTGNIMSYLDLYNHFRDKFFYRFRPSTMPYEEIPLGVIAIENSPVMFRGCTKDYSMPLVTVNDKNLINDLIRGHRSSQTYIDLRPVGHFHIGGIHELSKHPLVESYKHLIKEVNGTFSKKALNESTCPDLLRERLHSLLFTEPSYWIPDDYLPPFKSYWQLMGYSTLEEAEEATIEELLDRTNILMVDLNSRLKKKGSARLDIDRYSQLLSVRESLNQLQSDSKLGALAYSLDNLFAYINGSIETSLIAIEKILPLIINNFVSLFSYNFPQLTKYSTFLQLIEKLFIVEVIKDSSMWSNNLSLSYIVCPNISNTRPIRVINTEKEPSIVRRLSIKTLTGTSYSGGCESGIGFTELRADINGKTVFDPEARVIKTNFPSRTPLIDQVYSLLSQDIGLILNVDHLGRFSS